MSEELNKVEDNAKVSDEELEQVSGGIWPFSVKNPLSDDDLEKVTGGAYIDNGEVKTVDNKDGSTKLGKTKGKERFY